MKPEEIKPDTRLCTILGHNAQTGYMRKYFNKILKHNHMNATAIALNITDEHFDFTMSNVADSKVDRMMIEKEFSAKAIEYCKNLNSCAKDHQRVDFIEVNNGQVEGFCLDDEAYKLFDQPEFLDDQIIFIAKMMILANRWFNVEIKTDDIPILIGDN